MEKTAWQTIVVNCDNATIVNIINTRQSKNLFTMNFVYVWYEASTSLRTRRIVG